MLHVRSGDLQMETSKTGNKRVTLAEIAREAGVSVGLVSSFLSGKNYGDGGGSGIRIGTETAGRILGTCRRLNYQPERSDTFRLIYPELAPVALAGSVREQFQANRYHSLILDGVVAGTSTHSLSLSLVQYDPGTDYEAHPELLPEWVAEGQTGKCIFAGTPNPGLLRLLVQRGIHLVYASRNPAVPGVSCVVPDYREAATMAVRYLHNLGHRRIGFFALDYFSGTYPGKELLAGARQALDELGLEGLLNVTPTGSSPPGERAATALRQFMQDAAPATAVFAFDDLSAETIAHAAAASGVGIPGDLSLVGCNDERQSVHMHPPLTTVHLPVFEIGRLAVELVNQLAVSPGPAPDQCRVLPVFMVERATTRRL
jgi:DNA-binding LacI/PurR family transcriptional regulator